MFALHAPDGFLEPHVAVITAIISAFLVTIALRRSSAELGDRQVPLAGIAAAFIFAAQMFNFPVASGTSGHLLGATLAAVLLGPWVGLLVVAIVVGVQALVFADGGLTALGYNTLNMAVVPAFGGFALFVLFRRVLPRNSSGVVAASALAGGISVVLSAVTFSLEWLVGASAPVAFDTVFAAMVGTHLLIGIGEGLITGMVVGAVLAARPDLVVGASDIDTTLLAQRSRVAGRTFTIGALAAALFCAAIVSQFASSSPDGLETVAASTGITASADPGDAGDAGDAGFLGDTVLADYATDGIDNQRVSLAVAGIAGVALTLLLGFGMTHARRRPGQTLRS